VPGGEHKWPYVPPARWRQVYGSAGWPQEKTELLPEEAASESSAARPLSPPEAEGESPGPLDIRQQTLAVARVAHELKTPLSVIVGYIELLLSEKLGELNPQQRQVLLETQPNCARLERFIKEFLAYGALEADSATVDFQLADLNACLSEVCRYWFDRYCTKGVALYFPANPKLEPFEFDYHKVQQVASNLLENALKFTPQGGTVWIVAEPHIWEIPEFSETGDLTPVNAARVSITDTGPGISPEYHREIFDHFFKVSHKDHPGGTGLGLAIARRIVQAHGGKIWVESEPGAGCKFIFLLPLAPAARTLPSGDSDEG
jgi:two-component system sensor histidine kinase/response regulator